MNNDSKYRVWRECPAPLNISPDFAGDVMRRIYRQTEQQQKAKPKWSGFFDFFQQNRSLQFAALVVAAIIGLSRFWFIISIILKPSTIN